MIATPDGKPTVASLALLEIPRIPIGTRPLMVAFMSTDGTRLLRSVMSPAFDLSRAAFDSTEAATGTSCSLSTRFWAVMTISSSSPTGAAGGAACASTTAGTAVAQQISTAERRYEFTGVDPPLDQTLSDPHRAWRRFLCMFASRPSRLEL